VKQQQQQQQQSHHLQSFYRTLKTSTATSLKATTIPRINCSFFSSLHSSFNNSTSEQHSHNSPNLANFGQTVSTLLETIPNFPYYGLHPPGSSPASRIYSPKIILYEPVVTRFKCQGRRYYILLAFCIKWWLRFWYFEGGDIEILRVNQDRISANLNQKSMSQSQNEDDHPHPSDVDPEFPIPHPQRNRNPPLPNFPSPNKPTYPNPNSPYPLPSPSSPSSPSSLNTIDSFQYPPLRVRFLFHGIPRWHYVFPSLVSSSPDGNYSPPTFEGVFLYKFDGQGQVSEHIIEGLFPVPRVFKWFSAGSAPDSVIGVVGCNRK